MYREQSESWTDIGLLHELQQGNECAFTDLYHQHSKTLYRKILRMVNDEEIAKELLQDLFMRLWENREKVDASKSFRSYLYTIAVNLVYDYFRKAAKQKEVESHLLAMAVDHFTDFEDALVAKENIQLINDVINKLSPQRKKIFMLCKVDGKSYEEVSKELNISKSTIHDHIVKANHVIKDYLRSNPGIAIYLMISTVFNYLK
jgi:RNA polymerase sigma-70 factor (ECF subfamily)